MRHTLTTQTGRKGYARHNDRTYEGADQVKARLNDYRQIYDGMTFEENERKYYEEMFSEHIRLQNEACRKNRHLERMTDLDKLYTSPATRPDEVILEIGNKESHASEKELRAVWNDYYKWHSHRFPDIAVLDSALHLDEATPHIHIRQTYVVWDERGIPHPKQDKCLKAAGLSLPNPDKPRGRYNNLKMTYTALCREKLMEICKAHGIEVIKAPERAEREKGLSKEEFLDKKIAEAVATKALFEKLLEPENFYREYVAKHDTIQDYLRDEKYRALPGGFERNRGVWQDHLRRQAERLLQAEVQEMKRHHSRAR